MDKEYSSQVVILAVRNPLDVFVSFFQMVCTQTHTKSFSNAIDKYPLKEFWDHFYDTDVKCWVDWHDFWLKKAREQSIPVYFFRFEDLLITPQPVLKDMFKFILAEKDLDDSVIEKRIKDVIETGKNFLYKPRAAGGGFHKHVDKLEPHQMQLLYDKLEYYLQFFGYAKNEKSQEFKDQGHNIYEFYDYEGRAKPEFQKEYMGFVELNNKMLDKRVQERLSENYS